MYTPKNKQFTMASKVPTINDNNKVHQFNQQQQQQQYHNERQMQQNGCVNSNNNNNNNISNSISQGNFGNVILGVKHKVTVRIVDTSNRDAVEKELEVEYEETKIVGVGSFGVVSQSVITGRENEQFAIKKVKQDLRYKNRELQIMKTITHPNIVMVEYYFFTSINEDVYLNLVLEYVPDTISHACRQYTRTNECMPVLLIKLYIYQLFKSLNYIHSIGVCHRDIKPQNLLVNQETGVLKLCDFGSAKVLVKGEANVAYICSRYYRAPELLFGAREYTTAIDIWSTGCVLGEMLLGRPMFPGAHGVDQLVEIIRVLGTPTTEEIYSMNPHYDEAEFPTIKPRAWSKVFQDVNLSIDDDMLGLLDDMLKFVPQDRIVAKAALHSSFFNCLKDKNSRLPNGKPLPDIFSTR